MRPSPSAGAGAGASPYGSSSLVKSSSAASAGTNSPRFPALPAAATARSQQQHTAVLPPPHRSPVPSPERLGGVGVPADSNQDWLSSPRTHRMLQLLGVAPSKLANAAPAPPPAAASDEPKHALSATGTNYLEQLRSAQRQQLVSQQYATQLARQNNQEAHSTPQYSPHPPASVMKSSPSLYSPYSPRSARNDPLSLGEEKQEWRDGTQDDAYGPLSSSNHPRMFLPVTGPGGRRFQPRKPSASPSAAGPRKAATAGPGTALTIFDPARSPSNATAGPLSSTSPSHTAATAAAGHFTPPERQLVLDYLTSDSCHLFTPVLDDASLEDRNRHDITEAHLDALLTLCQDGPSVVRQLRSLDRQHIRFHDIFALIAGVEAIVARKAAMLAWMLGQQPPPQVQPDGSYLAPPQHQECHLFGQSPFVVFLNSQAMDRLVEESTAWKLASLPQTLGQEANDPASLASPLPPPPPPLPTQPFDDVFHILLKLNENSSKQGEFHYFSQLIAHVRRVVEGVLAANGQGFAISAGTNAEQQSSPQEEAPRFKRVGGVGGGSGTKKPSISTRAHAPGRTPRAARLPQQPAPSARNLLASSSYGKNKSAAAAAAGAAATLVPIPAEEKRDHASESEESGASEPKRGPAPNLVASLRASVTSFLSSPECGIFLDFSALQSREPAGGGRSGTRSNDAQAELDDLIHCLLRSSANSDGSSSDASSSAEEQCLQALQFISTHRSTVYASIPDLIAAIKGGLIDGSHSATAGPSAGRTSTNEPTAIQALMTRKKAKKKQGPAAASAAATASKKPAVVSNSSSAPVLPGVGAHSAHHVNLDSKKQRLALLAFLTSSGAGLIQPKPDASKLYAELLALPAGTLPSDTLEKLRRIQDENQAAATAAGQQAPPHPTFKNLAEALAYTGAMAGAHGAAGGSGSGDDTRQQVQAFLSSPGCLLFGAPRSQANGLASPPPPAAGAIPTLTPAQAARVVEEGGAGSQTLQHLRALEGEGQVFPDLDALIAAVQTRHIEHLLRKQRQTLGASYPLPHHNGQAGAAAAAADGRVTIEAAIEMDGAARAGGAAKSASPTATAPEPIPLNRQRRAVWDWLHDDPSCVLVPRGYEWTIEEVEGMVDSLLPLCSAPNGPRPLVVDLLVEENGRLLSRGSDPYPTGAQLMAALLQLRSFLAPAAAATGSSSLVLPPVDPQDVSSEMHANIAEFLSSPECALLHGEALYDEDIQELVAAGGHDCLLFLWELHETDRSFLCVNPDLTEALARKRLDQSQLEKSWARVVLLRLKKDASTLFGPSFEKQKKILDALSANPAQIEALARVEASSSEEAVEAHPASVLTHLNALIYYASTSHRHFASFDDIVSTIHAGLRSEIRLQAAVLEHLVSLGPGLFSRPEASVTPAQVAQLFEWSRGGYRTLEYISALTSPSSWSSEDGTSLFAFFHDLTRAVRSVHAGMRLAYARGDAQAQWNEVAFSSAFAMAPDSLPKAAYYPRVDMVAFTGLTDAEKRMAWARASSRPQRHVEQRARRQDGGTRLWRERFEEFEMEAHMPSDECVLSSGVRASRAQPPAWLAAEREEAARLLTLLDPHPASDAGLADPFPLPPHLRPEPAILSAVRLNPSLRAQQDAMPSSTWWDAAESHASREARAFKRLEAAQGPNGPQLRLGRISGLQRMQLSRVEEHLRELGITSLSAAAAANAANASSLLPVVRMKPEVELLSDVLVSPSRLVFPAPAALVDDPAAVAAGETKLPTHINKRFLVRNDDAECTFLAQLVLEGDAKYTVTSANPQYLPPGGLASFIVEYDPAASSDPKPPQFDKLASVVPTGTPLAALGLHVETGESAAVDPPVSPRSRRVLLPGEAILYLKLAPVLEDEPLHFTAEDLAQLNPHRVAQIGPVARCMLDRSGIKQKKKPAQQVIASGGSAATSSTPAPAQSSAAESASSIAAAPAPAPAPAAESSSAVVSKPAPQAGGNDVGQSSGAPASFVAPAEVAASSSSSSSIAAHLPPEIPPEEQAEIEAAAKKRRAKRMTQAVDIHQIRSSGLLKGKVETRAPESESAQSSGSTSAAPPTATSSASSSAPGEVVASFSHLPPASPPASRRRADLASESVAGADAPIALVCTPLAASSSSSSSPLAIAAMDASYAQVDAATKRKNKRATQAISGLAEHVRMAAAAKAAAAEAAASGGGSSSAQASARSSALPVASSSSSDEQPVVPPSASLAGMTSSPVSIAAMDSQLAALTPEQKRKAKRATQSVDPLIAAALMHRKLAAKPVEAVNTVAAAPSTSASAPAAATAAAVPLAVSTAHPSSAVAIAAADESTTAALGAMTPVEKRRAKRATTITSELAPTMSPVRTGRSLGGPASSASSSPSSPPIASDSPPPAFSLGATAASENPSGAVAVAHADTQVNAMSARERNRSKRMTQALHDASYSTHTSASAPISRAQRIEQENDDPLAIAKAAALERDKVRAAMADLRATPRLAAACPAQQSAEALESWWPSPPFVAYRTEDPLRRLKAERELDLESFPPKHPTPPESTHPTQYFVAALGSVAVSHPNGMELHPHAPLPLQVQNVCEHTLALFALASDEEYVLHEPTPVFIAPGASFFLHVSCEAPHLPGAELGLVLKPLLPGEERLHPGAGAEGAKEFWKKHPYRIMQKVTIPLQCTALQRAPQTRASGGAAAAGQPSSAAGSATSSPTAATDDSGRPLPRRVRNDRVSGSDYTYPGLSKEEEKRQQAAAVAAAAVVASKAKAAAETPAQSSEEAAKPQVASPRLSALASPSNATSLADAAPFDTAYRRDAEARIVGARTANYPDYVHLKDLAPLGEAGADMAVRTNTNNNSTVHANAASSASAAAAADGGVTVAGSIATLEPDASLSPAAAAAELTRVQGRLFTVSPQERQAAYRAQVRLDGESRVVEQRHREYPAFAGPEQEEKQEQALTDAAAQK